MTSLGGPAEPPASSSSPASPTDASEDAEVDQLDESGAEDEPPPAVGEIEFEPSDDDEAELVPGTYKKTSRQKLVRAPGFTLVPADRMEFILHADGLAHHMSKEAFHLVSCATEEFIRRLADSSGRTATMVQQPFVSYKDISEPTLQYQELMFLQPTIPTPIPLSDALEKRAAKAAEVLAEDPSLAPPTTLPSFTFSTTVAHVAGQRVSRTGRASAGPSASGSGSATGRSSSARPAPQGDPNFDPAPSRKKRRDDSGAAPSLDMVAGGARRPARATRQARAVSSASALVDHSDDHTAYAPGVQAYGALVAPPPLPNGHPVSPETLLASPLHDAHPIKHETSPPPLQPPPDVHTVALLGLEAQDGSWPGRPPLSQNSFTPSLNNGQNHGRTIYSQR